MLIDDPNLQALLKQAAREGAQQALREIGLHDEEAGKDINDLRDLIEGWRSLRRTVVVTFAKWITIVVLGLISIGAYHNWGGDK